MSFRGQLAARRAPRVLAWVLAGGRSDPRHSSPRRPHASKIHAICLTARGVGYHRRQDQSTAIERAGGATQVPQSAEGKWPGWMRRSSAWTR